MPEKLPHFNRTRIAPTPSGFLHLGNVLSFVITAAIAEKTNAKILLRIDDLDRERVRNEYVQDIFDTLNFLEIPWHEGPRNFREYETEFSQIRRLDLYNDVLEKLRSSRQVFACTCSRAQIRDINPDEIYPGTCRDKGISLDANDVSWRLRADGAKEIAINTLDDRTIKTELPATMQDFIVRKKDSYPAYQLASVVDDLHFGVDLVVRGEDLYASTLAQAHLAIVLHGDAFQKVTFYHHPLLTTLSGKKLSKSAGDTSIRYLREQGKKPSDVYTEIAGMLGFEENVKDWRKLAEIAGF
jgi:glutamyl/glutaminyl-tRNA synthetase